MEAGTCCRRRRGQGDRYVRRGVCGTEERPAGRVCATAAARSARRPPPRRRLGRRRRTPVARGPLNSLRCCHTQWYTGSATVARATSPSRLPRHSRFPTDTTAVITPIHMNQPPTARQCTPLHSRHAPHNISFPHNGSICSIYDRRRWYPTPISMAGEWGSEWAST